MMNRPRWLLAFVSLIAINTLAVIVSSAWHLAKAQEAATAQASLPSNTADDTVPENRQAPDPPVGNGLAFDFQAPDESSPSKPVSGGATDKPESQTAIRSPELDFGIPNVPPPSLDPALPTSVPAEIPSLASEEDMNRDPIFQEFKNMFGGASREATSTAPTTTLYLDSLSERLKTAEQLTNSAHRIVEEARRLHSENRSEAAEKLLKMTVQLREIAAELLISEL